MTAQELKNSILQLAIQGKLVKQDPNDEPASVLLEKIREEREKLIKEKKIKREKYSEIYKESSDNHYYEKFEDGTINDITEEIPFDIPNSWRWTRLNAITRIITGFSFKSTDLKAHNNVRVIRISDFNENGLKDTNIVRINQNEKFENYSIKDNSILIAMTGGTVGKSFYIEHIKEKMYLNQRVACVNTFFETIYIDYIYIVIQSPFIKRLINESKNSTNDNISIDLINKFLIPLPTLNEQRKIIDKISLINPVINNYNYKYKKLESLNNNYKEELKKSILQYAIQGKLVNQESNDEPAEVLINKILDEKRRLIKTKQIKKENLSVIYKDSTDNQFYEKFDDGTIKNITEEIPFEIPNNWCWTRLNNIGETNIGLTYKPSDISDHGIIVLRSSNIQNGKIDYTDTVKVNINIPESKKCYKNDILICARNGSKKLVGKSALIDNTGMTFGAFMAIYRSILNPYIYLVLNSNYFRNSVIGDVGTTTINQLTQPMIKNFLIAIPPIKEQERIIYKIEKLLKVL